MNALYFTRGLKLTGTYSIMIQKVRARRSPLDFCVSLSYTHYYRVPVPLAPEAVGAVWGQRAGPGHGVGQGGAAEKVWDEELGKREAMYLISASCSTGAQDPLSKTFSVSCWSTCCS